MRIYTEADTTPDEKGLTGMTPLERTFFAVQPHLTTHAKSG
jgi:hypothetical protein